MINKIDIKELTNKLYELKDSEIKDKDHLLSEIADIEIMLEQQKELQIEQPDIYEEKQFNLYRQLMRLQKEENDVR